MTCPYDEKAECNLKECLRDCVPYTMNELLNAELRYEMAGLALASAISELREAIR